MAIEFKRDYEQLQLEFDSNWETARAHYRKLVNHWHPDRYTQRPREREHAQQKFIELNRSFNSLRSFYKLNNRLPYQRILHSQSDAAVPEQHQRIQPSEADVMASSILNKRKTSSTTWKNSNLKPMLWAVPVALVLVLATAVFIVIDSNSKLNTIEEAKRVLRQAQTTQLGADVSITSADSSSN